MHTEFRVDPGRGQALLKKTLLRLMAAEGNYPAAGGLTLYRRHNNDMEHRPIIYQPVLIVIAQGEKSVKIGPDHFIYGEGSYFVTGVNMPTACAVRGVSADRPFLSLSLDIDKSLIARMAAEGGCEMKEPPRGSMVAPLEPALLDALMRLVELTERPDEARVIAPLTVMEIHYRLLRGPFGSQLRALSLPGTLSNQVARSIVWLKENFREPFQIDDLAKRSNMSPSTFHKYFKNFTALSPLQYQKRLRLEEANRLMLVRGYDAARASEAVGYESVQQFNREYKRLFGAPPRRDIMKMRESGLAV